MSIANITRYAGRAGLLLKKYAPEILTATGIVGGVTAAVMAVKAAPKAEPIIQEAEETLSLIASRVEGKEFTDKDMVQDRIHVYVKTGMGIAKTYGPAITLGAFSIVSILAAHGLMQRRNVALAAAYKTMELSFKEYRARIVERFGLEVDREMLYGKTKAVVVHDDGEEEEVEIIGGELDGSPYSVFFDEHSIHWQRDAQMNRMFLMSVQNHLNDLLRVRGHVFLNEVYDALGVPRRKEGAVVGWLADVNENVGDGYIDFGVFNSSDESAKLFVNGIERSALLDFNVDGVIYDKI